jgi:branched-subunit amino acid transport protein AzlD
VTNACGIQAFKMFTSGKSEKGSGGSQNDLISMAMAEASKLFDRSGGASSGNKQDAVNGAAMTVMKLMVQSKMSGMVGGKDSGGLSGLMGMVCTPTLFLRQYFITSFLGVEDLVSVGTAVLLFVWRWNVRLSITDIKRRPTCVITLDGCEM